MSSWSNPNPSLSYAELMRGHSFSGGSSGAGHVPPNQWAEAGQQAISAVAKLLQERKRQQIAQTLLDHASYDSNNGEGDPLARSLNESKMAPIEAWTAYQQQREYDADQLNQNIKAQHYQRMSEALSAKTAPPIPPVQDQASGLYWNGHAWVHGANRGSAATSAKQMMLDKSLSPYGLTSDDLSGVDFETPGAISYVDMATGKQISTEAANMNPKGTNAVLTVAGKESPTAIPYSKFLSVHQLFKNTEGPNATPPSDPLPATAGKPLDKETAAAILKEAGGDPEKARELARQRGYTF